MVNCSSEIIITFCEWLTASKVNFREKKVDNCKVETSSILLIRNLLQALAPHATRHMHHAYPTGAKNVIDFWLPGKLHLVGVFSKLKQVLLLLTFPQFLPLSYVADSHPYP